MGKKKRIRITNKEKASSFVVWREFCNFAVNCASEYTLTQKTAVLAARYYLAVCERGHAGFFEQHKNEDIGEIVEALKVIGASEFADNLLSMVRTDRADNYKAEDDRLLENSEVLHTAIENNLYNNFDEFFEVTDSDSDYTMRPYRYRMIVRHCVIITAVIFVAMLIVGFTKLIAASWWVFVLAAFAGAGPVIIEAVYYKVWRVSVESMKKVCKIEKGTRPPVI